MTLSKLSKEIQELLREGIAIIYVWKIGKSWRYSEFWYEDLNEKTFSMEDQISIDSIIEAASAVYPEVILKMEAIAGTRKIIPIKP